MHESLLLLLPSFVLPLFFPSQITFFCLLVGFFVLLFCCLSFGAFLFACIFFLVRLILWCVPRERKCLHMNTHCIYVYAIAVCILFAIPFMRSDLKMSNEPGDHTSLYIVRARTTFSEYCCPFKFHMVYRKTCVARLSYGNVFVFFTLFIYWASKRWPLRLRAHFIIRTISDTLNRSTKILLWFALHQTHIQSKNSNNKNKKETKRRKRTKSLVGKVIFFFFF